MSITPMAPTSASGVEIDPVTFEVIRHRLWAINDDQAMMAARLSGSPVVYEAFDFNAAILTPDGQGVYAGIFIIQHATSLDFFVQRVLELWGPDEIRDGDLFFTNDPWSGALHANDGILAAPIFSNGELIAWSAIVMHDNDVGSMAPGSFVVGARERFAEAPLFPPIKIAEDFRFRRDLEAAYLYNHRTPELSALNLRARLASLKATRDRLRDLVDQYGIEAFRAARDGIIDYTEEIVRTRLREIPDGSWFDQVYLDHNGNENTIYPIRCQLTKRGDRLIADFTGTAQQADGSINCAKPALEAAVIGTFLVFLCHDLPWSVGAARRIVEIVSEPGTVNNAESPAGVSMASVMAALTTQDAVNCAMGKMLMTSVTHGSEAQACWAAGHNLLVLAGRDRHGETLALPLLDAVGGGAGARSFADGVDSGGVLVSLSATIPNVETSESRAPFLQIYRRESPDSCGHGRFRGGAGIEFAFVPHRNPGALIDIAVASGVSQPEAHGIAGGGPAAVKSNTVLRQTDVQALFARGVLPGSSGELRAQATEVLEAKQQTELTHDDVHIAVIAGGGGYGDPIRREPESVARDVANGLVSDQIAHTVYGVAIARGEVDPAETERTRERIREARLRDGRRVDGSDAPIEYVSAAGGSVLHPVADTLEAVEIDDQRWIRCTVCSHRLSGYHDDYKRGTLMRELPITSASPLNALGDEDGFVLREFACPGCATAVAVDVQRREEPVLPEATFDG